MTNLANRVLELLNRFLRLFIYILIKPSHLNIIINILFKYAYSVLFLNRILNKKYSKEKNEFKKFCENKLFFNQKDLFSNNIPSWLNLFEKFSLKKKNLKVLEIGSYEGRSSVFILEYLKNAHLTCVDNFEPFQELLGDNKKFNLVYENFIKNINRYSKRVSVKKEKSSNFFFNNKDKFDFIFIDGSHKFADVINDAFESFKILNSGGIIIFDDFLWHNHQKFNNSITFAIITFLHSNKNKIKIIYSNYQIMIKKIS